MLAIGCALLASTGIATAAVLFEHSAEASRADRVASGGKTVSGCVLRESSAGYPDDYVTRTLPYKVHPPLPVSGWRTRPLAFDVLFHSIFHGYLVITYRPDVPRAELATLRSWVRSHARQRIVGTPAGDAGAGVQVHVAVWGSELRCNGAVPSSAVLDRLATQRGT